MADGRTALPKGKIVLYKKRMLDLVKKLNANRNLLKNLVIRDIKHRYVGSVGGFLWSVVHPLALLVSYTFAFGVMMPQKMGAEYGVDSFAIFVVCGLLPWLLFSDTLMRNCSVISDNALLITKTVIPAEIIPISITISNLIHHLIGVGLLLGVMGAFYGVHASTLWIILYMPILLMLAQGLGWIAASLHVFLRDTLQTLQIVMLLWFFFTPILYTSNRFPENMRFLATLNPMALIVTGYRNSLLGLSQPDGLAVTFVFALSVITFAAGAWFFRQTKPAFPDVL
jgi:lipopolysaccharide transport system permease protein